MHIEWPHNAFVPYKWRLEYYLGCLWLKSSCFSFIIKSAIKYCSITMTHIVNAWRSCTGWWQRVNYNKTYSTYKQHEIKTFWYRGTTALITRLVKICKDIFWIDKQTSMNLDLRHINWHSIGTESPINSLWVLYKKAYFYLQYSTVDSHKNYIIWSV